MIPADSSYGSDRSGLISGFLFRPAAAGTPLDTAGAARWLAEAGAEAEAGDGAFAWLHFNLAHAATERWLRDHLGEVDEFFDALHEGSHSTRIEYAHAALIAVVNDVLYEFDFEPSQIATLWMWVDERTVVTARLQPLRSIDRLRAAVKRGEIFGSSVALLTHLLRDQADVLVQIVRAATGRVDEVEDSHEQLDDGTGRELLAHGDAGSSPRPWGTRPGAGAPAPPAGTGAGGLVPAAQPAAGLGGG